MNKWITKNKNIKYMHNYKWYIIIIKNLKKKKKCEKKNRNEKSLKKIKINKKNIKLKGSAYNLLTWLRNYWFPWRREVTEHENNASEASDSESNNTYSEASTTSTRGLRST